MQTKSLLTVRVLSLILFFLISGSLEQTHAQETERYEKFTNAGLIGISNQYTLPPGNKSIIFRIKNQSSRTISQIYGWVYKIEEVADNQDKKFLLLNNPHKGGYIVKGRPHLPGTVSDWSFPLIKKPTAPDQQTRYTLSVHSRSIFFANVEPPTKRNEKPENQ